MDKKYAIFGSGMQSVTSAYDLGKFGNAKQILMIDKKQHIADQSADLANHYLKKNICLGLELDFSDENLDEIIEILSKCDACLSCLPPRFNFDLTACAIKANCHMNDLGGDSFVVGQQQERFHNDAVTSNVSIVPNCGLAPGACNVFASLLIQNGATDIKIYCGGIPSEDDDDIFLKYKKTFSVKGLINEYAGYAEYLRDNKILFVPALMKEETHSVNIDGTTLEASPTSGGTSFGPEIFKPIIKNYEYKTLRYHGHFDFFRNLKELNLLENNEVVESLGKNLENDSVKDKVLLEVRGKTDNNRNHAIYLCAYQNDKFTAMAQTTGFSAAIVTAMQTNGMILPGVKTMESAVGASIFLEEFKKRFPQTKITIEK